MRRCCVLTLLVCSTLLLTSLAIADLTLNYTEVEFQLQPRPRDRTRLTGYLKWDTIEGEFHDSGRCFDPSSSASGTTVVEITLRPLLLPAVQLQDGPTRHESARSNVGDSNPGGG